LILKGGTSGDNALVSNGTEWHPQCLGGYSGPFCDACPVGTYKYGFSYGRCLPCENKPAKNSFYSERGVKTSYCPYKCDAGLEPSTVNPDCLNHIELQIQKLLGDMTLTLVVLGIFLLLTLLQWVRLIKRRTALNINPVADMNDIDIEGFDEEIEYSCTKQMKSAAFLRYHTYRVYFMGLNSAKLPWAVPLQDIPEGVLE